ncbi:MAG: MFS transporter [Pseudomonadota bacterium]
MASESNKAHRFYWFSMAAFLPTGIISALTIYYMKWATDVLLIAPILISAILTIGTIWDGLTDPIVAAYTDRRRTAGGRRKPILRIGLILFAVSAFFIWLPPASLSGMALFIWLLISFMIYRLGATFVNVPLMALGLEIFRQSNRRLLARVSQAVPVLLSSLIALLGLGFIVTNDTPREVLFWVLMGPAVVIFALGLFAVRLVPEPSSEHRPRETSIWRMLSDVIGNPYHRSILIVQILHVLAYVSLSFNTPFMVDAILGDEAMLALIFGAFYLAIGLGMPTLAWLSARIGMVSLWKVGVRLWIFAFGLACTLPFLPVSVALILFFVIAVMGGLAEASGLVIYPIMGDLVDYDADRSGHRREGLYVTVFGLVGKVAAALVSLVLGIALQTSGYVPNAEQQAREVIYALAFCGAFIPMVLSIFALWWLGRWKFYQVQPEYDQYARHDSGSMAGFEGAQ